ncbi:MaoC/PaaZ C-terminal domain-containing protein, partial [Ideonella sp.]|uniref:MaoC/PaaZ C-terminal domain-containing protein n=1 Tax=Ideonella sp. TaxID=1929293 RepID=UPI003BB7F51C
MSPVHLIENITFDELQVGQTAQLQRLIRMADIQAFALVSGDVNPAHVDAEYADASRFHGVIAHGMFAGALISTLLGTEFPGPGTIYMAQSLQFERPVRVGDTLDVTLTVRDKDEANGNVNLDCSVRNQRGEQVVSGLALVKAPRHKITRPQADLPTLHLFDPEARLAEWVHGLLPGPAVRCAVVHPC